MKKLALMSDLHIDSNQWGDWEFDQLTNLLREERIDHLHLAGDLSNNWKEISLPFLEKLKKQLPVSWNLGNHDMLNLTEEEIQDQQIKLMDLGSYYLLAIDGWYDYAFAKEDNPQVHQKNKERYWFDRRLKRDGSDPQITDQLLKKLEARLKELDKPIILAMHFVPHQNFILQHPYFERFNAYLGSPRFHQLFKNYPIKEVIFGHTHHRFERRKIDNIYYQAKPLGYQREWRLVQNFFQAYPEYKIEQMYHLHKRYAAIRNLALFQDYKKEHFKDELREAMIIIDY